VQDGGSTDGTLEILKRHEGRISLCSEADKGIYDAWNKAIKRASGDWIIFPGADDALMGPHVLARCAHYLKELPADTAFAYGALLHGRNGVGTSVMNRSLREVYRLFAGNMGLPFSATFVRGALLREHRFDDTYKIAGDFEYAARLFTPHNIARIPVLIAYMELGGISNHEATQCLLHDERGKILYRRIMPKAQDIVTACMEHDWDENTFLEQENSEEQRPLV